MRRVLVTGGGAVSVAIAEALLRRGDSVVLWLHARSRGELERKAADCVLAGSAALSFRGGDLCDDEAFAGCEREAVTHVVHAAANTRFTVDAETAEIVNVRGTQRALEFARGCRRLESFTFVSSVHAAGLRVGELCEEILAEDPAGFANEYERSKARAEALVGESELPWRILRLGTILAGDASGGLVQENAVHVTLRLMRSGLLPLVPGLGACPVHLLTADAAGEACARLLDAGPGCFHVSAPPQLTPTLQALLHRAHARLQHDEALRNRRVPAPLLVDQATFGLLVSGAEGLASPMVTQALRCLAPFARQLHAPKTLMTERAAAIAGDVLAIDPLPVLDRVMDRIGEPRRRLTETRA